MKKLLSVSWAARHGDLAWLFFRVVVGAVFAIHGYQKWQGGLEQTAGFLSTLGFPAPMLFGALLIAAELLGGVAIILGALTRFSAVANAIVSAVAFLTVHASQGFFVTDGGYEFILVLLAATVLIATNGGGRWSVDRRMLKLQ